MGLFSFLKRDTAAQAHAAPPADATSPESIRARVRRRFIGAAILVAAAVVVLPLMLDSKPRPLPVDIAIDIPKRDALAMPAVPAPRASAPEIIDEAPVAVAPQPAPQPAPAASVPQPVAMASSPAPAKPVPPKPAPVTAPAAEPAPKPAPKPVAEPAKPVGPKPAPRTEPDRRALALLEGQDAKPPAAKPAADASGTRFVVQVGAFEQAGAAKEARQRVEKLGLQTFVQEITTPQGKRIRVRLGPYASRDEAERAQARLGAGGIQASVVPQ